MSFECNSYKIYFHLWRRGGPNWRSEFANFLKEEQSSWINVGKSPQSGSLVTKNRSFADVAKGHPLTGANSTPLKATNNPNVTEDTRRKSVFGRIHFPVSQKFDQILLGKEEISNSKQPDSSINQARCSRCLSATHTRKHCHNAIKCTACYGWGHVEAACFKISNSSQAGGHIGFQKTREEKPRSSSKWFQAQPIWVFNGKAPCQAQDTSTWFRKVQNGPGPSGLTLHNQFERMMAASDDVSSDLNTVPRLNLTSEQCVPPHSGGVNENEELISCSLSLGGVFSASKTNVINPPPPLLDRSPASSSQPQCNQPATHPHSHPTPPPLITAPLPSELPQPSLLSNMAFQRADPTPFVPNGMHHLNLGGRAPMVRAVARSRPPRANESVAIATFDYLPGNALHFPTVRQILEEFFEERNVAVQSIQPTHLGQATVVFNSPLDREAMVLNSPLPMGNIQISFVRHNQARNWRRVVFNHDCWLMLMGFPLDFWETDYIQDAICSFGRVDNWINNRGKLSRVLVRARVANLQSVPHWIVYTDGMGNNLDTWSVQVEIVAHDFVGAGPPLEDPAPQHVDHLAFDFFGYGQPGAGPAIGGGAHHNQIGLPPLGGQGGQHAQHEQGALNVQIGQGDQNVQIVQGGQNVQDGQNVQIVQGGQNVQMGQAQPDPVQNQDHQVDENAENAENQANEVAENNLQLAQGNEFIDDLAQADQDMNDVDDDLEDNQEEIGGNPNLPWDIAAAQMAPMPGWGQWPAPPQVPQPQNPQIIQIDLNNAPPNEMQEVIINPAYAPPAGHFNQIIAVPEVEEPVIQANANEEEPLNVVLAMQQQMHDNFLAQFPHLPIAAPVIDDEEDAVPEHMLLDGNESEEEPENEDDQEPIGNQVLHVGAVIIRDNPFPDPSVLKDNKCFSAMIAALDKEPGQTTQLAAQWAPFFSAMLLSPTNYNWAKSLMESEAWVFFSKSIDTIFIKIPAQAPAQEFTCSADMIMSDEFNANDQASVQSPHHVHLTQPSGGTSKKRKGKKVIVESEVRRSPRLKEANKGLKPIGCPTKRCSSCPPNPPELSMHLIKKLGADFCNVDEKSISEISLSQKKRKYGKSKAGSITAAINDENNPDGKPRTEPKKKKGSRRVVRKILKMNKTPESGEPQSEDVTASSDADAPMEGGEASNKNLE